ncbi:MAG: T9SS type A sorting domain-containing protein [Saprospiraceae bacterium]|nr:T9SS type A sorting domain-containing protein [Saprospiraceae bacterium]
MKSNITIGLFLSCLVWALFMNFSQGPANAQGQDRTGSPFTESSGTCQSCHSTGTFNPGLEIELLDNGTAVTEYEPNKTYTLRYTITANNGSPSGYGMQSVVLGTDDDSPVGSYGTAPSGMQLSDLEGRTYFEHQGINSNNVLEIEWTAPDAGVGSVTAYATGIAANGNGSSGGDAGASSSATFTELTTDIQELDGVFSRMAAFPNPVNERFQLSLNSTQAGTAQLLIADMTGRTIAEQQLALGLGANTFDLDAQNWEAGVYLLSVRMDNRVQTLRLMKQ